MKHDLRQLKSAHANAPRMKNLYRWVMGLMFVARQIEHLKDRLAPDDEDDEALRRPAPSPGRTVRQLRSRAVLKHNDEDDVRAT